MMATPPSQLYSSPKRKRRDSDLDTIYSPTASPTSTISIASLQERRLREEEDCGRSSPRAVVAGRLGTLAIIGEDLSLSRTSSRDAVPTERGFDGSMRNCQDSAERLDSAGTGEHSHNGFRPSPADHTSAVREPSRDPGSSSLSSSPQNPHESADLQQRSAQTRRRRSSPPLSTGCTENALTWHDSEITGHNPTDPNDDGYGINGIGFRPTAAIAWARSRRRQQQVAEWKNREAREARERRRERRHGTAPDQMRSVNTDDGTVQKRVKFDV